MKRRKRKPLGNVLHVLKNNIMIVRGKRKSKSKRKSLEAVSGLLNSVVLDGRNRGIGRIYDIFGPVDHPYISVKLFTGVNQNRAVADLKREEVFVLV